MIGERRVRAALLGCCLAFGACTTSKGDRRYRPRGPTAHQLAQDLTQLEGALEQGDIDSAEKVLAGLDADLKRVEVATITDPNYLRITRGIDEARQAVEKARASQGLPRWLVHARAGVAAADAALAKDDEDDFDERWRDLERVALQLDPLLTAGEAFASNPSAAAPLGELRVRQHAVARAILQLQARPAPQRADPHPTAAPEPKQEPAVTAPDDEPLWEESAPVAGEAAAGATIAWRQAVLRVQAVRQLAMKELERAERAGHQAERLVAYANALARLHQCASRAHWIATLDGLRWRGAQPSDEEVAALHRLADACLQTAAQVQVELSRPKE